MLFELDPESAMPPFEQVRRAILDGVRAGDLAAGDRLPPVRTLAAELGLAPNTVARSYRELERDGVIETRGRNGSFVRAPEVGAREQAQVAASDFVERVSRLGIEASETLAMVQNALESRGRRQRPDRGRSG